MKGMTLAEQVKVLEEDLAFWKKKSDAQGEMIVKLTTPTTKVLTKEYLSEALHVTVTIPRLSLMKDGIEVITAICRRLERELIDKAVRGPQ